MKKSLVKVLTVVSFLFGASTVSGQSVPGNCEISISKESDPRVKMTITADYKLGHLDTVFTALMRYITLEVDQTMQGEKFAVSDYKNNKGVIVFKGITHNIFFAMTRKSEQVVLIQSLTKNSLKGGKLEIVGDSWKMSPDGLIQNIHNSKPGYDYVYIGAKHGRFEIPAKNIWDTEYDDGY